MIDRQKDKKNTETSRQRGREADRHTDIKAGKEKH